MSTNTQTRVKEIMSTPVETIHRDATLSEVAAKMRDEDINALIVTTSTLGIVTSTDVLDAVARGEDTSDLDVEDVMTESVETIPPDIHIGEAAAMMTSLGIKHLPVVDQGDYVGMISSTDVAAQMS